MMPTPLKELDDAVESVRKHVAELSIRGLPQTPTAFNWTDEMQAIWPKDMRPTMSGLLAIWEAMQEAAVYGAAGATDGWTEWGGGECPVDPETRVEVKCRDGYMDDGKAKWFSKPNNSTDWWEWDAARSNHIIAYRVLP